MAEYSEREAAEKLGVTVDHFRALVKSFILHEGEVPAAAVFRDSDLVLLRVLETMSGNALPD